VRRAAPRCASEQRQRMQPVIDQNRMTSKIEAIQPHWEGDTTANPSQGIAWRAWSSAISAAPDDNWRQ